MKYLEIHIRAESGDDIGDFLSAISEHLNKMNYELAYKDNIVEEMVRAFLAEHLSDDKYFKKTNPGTDEI